MVVKLKKKLSLHISWREKELKATGTSEDWCWEDHIGIRLQVEAEKEKMILPATHKGGDLICAEVIQGLSSSLSAARMLWPIIQWKAFKEREEL